MSTFYLDSIEEIDDCLEDNFGTSDVEYHKAGFSEDKIPTSLGVIITDSQAFIVVAGDIHFEVYVMSRNEFMSKWSESVWAKFRIDSYTHICPECGEKMAHSVAGRTLSDIGRIEQFHCDNCHYTWVGYPSGKFIREGVLH